ncbi:MAG: hypothetical protein NC120_13215 [Ruminococcus sp.]|nr:hypothetical protein [Ruminococcus sp.]
MIKSRLVSVIAAAAVSASAVTALSAGVSAEWVKSDSGYSYTSDKTGKKLTGWQTVGDGKYYFDKYGIALTGWKKINGDTYYFNSAKKGKMLTGWVKIGESRYYFGSDGKMRTGMRKLGDDTYYFGSDGKMRTGKLKINGKIYDFGTDGKLRNAAASSESMLDKPLKGLSWGMSMDDVIEKGGFESYFIQEPMVMVFDTEPYGYYIFDSDSKLMACGYAIDYSDGSVAKFKGWFKDEGWKLEDTDDDNGTSMYIYSKSDRKKIGAVMYNGDIVMSLVFSDEIAQQILDGDTGALSSLM